MGRNKAGILLLLLAILSLLIIKSASAADDAFKPYLHKATVPEHPKIKLYGSYQTQLFPGAATYTYQLEVPPGTNGLQPAISITYNSQNAKQRPGILGAGWQLSSTYVFRDVNGTVNKTSDDAFSFVLDGNMHKLAYNRSDGFYYAEIESAEANFKAENLTTASNTYGTYWLVTAKNGIRYTLGSNASSELTGTVTGDAANSYALKWSLDSVQDTYGNTISYTYQENPFTEDAGSVYLDHISYNNDKVRKIDFSYEANARPDRRRTYEQGNLVEESRRLTGINVSANGKLIRRYSFEYKSLNPEQSLTSLSKISFLANYGAELHNVQFDYYNATPGFHNETQWAIPDIFASYTNGDEGDRLVDVNNDGFIDIVRSKAEGAKKVWINNKTGWTDESSKWNFPLFIVDGAWKDNGVRLADLNSDGFVDIIRSLEDFGVSVKQVYLNNGSGWSNTSTATWNIPFIFVSKSDPPNEANDDGTRLVELNGDGRIDVIKSKKEVAGSETKAVYLNNGSGWTIPEKQDGNWTPPGLFLGLNGRDEGLREMDINGDGLDDLVEAQNLSGTPTFNTWLNTGTGWANATSTWKSPLVFTSTDPPDLGVRFADVNGDGLIDILQGFYEIINLWLNNGSGWINSSDWRPPESFVHNGKNIGRRLADINGDGFADILISFNNNSLETKYVWTKNGTIPYILKTIKTELGANITINYQNSTQYNNTNTTGQSQIGFNILVVSSVLQNNSLASFSTLANYSYNYSGGKYDNKNREFRGFSNVTETVPDGTTIRHSFRQDDILKGKEYRTETYSSNGQLYTATENTYNHTQTGNSFKVVLVSAATYTHDGTSANPKVTNTTYTYDQYGNVLTRRSLGDTSTPGDEKLELYDYVYNTTARIINTPSRYQLYATDNTTKLRDVKYIYDSGHFGSTPTKGSITSIQTLLDTGQNSQTDVQYDSFGNVKSETDALGRTSRYSYDYLTNTFPTGIINPAGHVTHFSYDAGTGNLLWQKKNDIATYFEYDNFSRIVKEIQPYDTSTFPTRNYTYLFDGTPPEIIIVKQKTSTNKTLDTYYLYDSFGQLVRVKTPATEGRQVVKNFFYDSLGRVKAEQNPYFDTFSTALSNPSSTAAFTNYTYDAISRVSNVTFPDNTSITVAFDHWTVSAYDQNSHRKDYYLDSYDRITKITEYNIDRVLDDGVVYLYNTTYGYDEADQLRRIVDAYGNNFTFTYDSLGRRTRLNDPDIGEWNYTYDLAGNLISQAGGGGNLVTGDGFFREYNSLNQLVKIRNGSNSSNALIEEYFYDPYGERIKIWRNDSAGTVVYTPFREFMQVRNSTGVYNYSYIYDGSTLIARVNPDGTKHYYHPDHLGSTTLITDESGNIVEETYYEPYGDVITGGTTDAKLYTGQYSDDATGQYYYGARYYKPGPDRFIQPDPMMQVYNPQSLNHYSYVLNNPYTNFDPNGREPLRSQALQSGSVESVYNYIRSIESANSDLTALQVLGKVTSDYNLRYENTALGDKSSAQFSSKFVYTADKGVIDQLHFFTNAYAIQLTSEANLVKAGYVLEAGQCGFTRSSCFSYEDLRSNKLGREFGKGLNNKERLSEQYKRFMSGTGAGDFPDWLWATMPEKDNTGVMLPGWKQDYFGFGQSLPRGFINPRTEKFVPLNHGESYNERTREIERNDWPMGTCKGWRC